MTTTSPKTTKSTKTGASQEDPVDMTTSDSNVNVGDKRKATTTTSETTKSNSNTENEEEGGKDLVEKKQTTLDDIVHSEKDHQKSAKEGSETKEGNDEERPAKKTKTEKSDDTEVKEKDDEVKGEKGDQVKEKEEKVENGKEGKVDKGEKVENDVEMKSSPSKSKSTTQTNKATTSSSKPEQTTTDAQAPLKPDQTPADTSSKPVGNGTEESTIPGDEAHLDHPENWTTGGDPATDKQKGFLKVLEKQKGVPVGDLGGIGKSEASEKIDELKNMCESIALCAMKLIDRMSR